MPNVPLQAPADETARMFAESLDMVDVGLLRLDSQLRVCFANRRFMEIWSVPEELMQGEPTFGLILTVAGNVAWQSLPARVRAAYLQGREDAVRAGAMPPERLDMTDGRHLLTRCDVCPDGGRLLTYIDITDQVRAVQLEAEERISAELRFNATTMESEAAHMAELAEAAEEQAQKAETARILLAQEIAERRELETRLRVLATTDGLTGILNRAAFLDQGQRAFEDARRTGHEFAVVMVDVDHFKSINDQHGHAGGDNALRHLVTVFERLIRGTDLFGRLGGEEFAVILPKTPFEPAKTVAERLRAGIEESPLTYADRKIAITISLGLAMAQPNEDNIEQLIARADHALYQAKQNGRNRVVIEHQTAVAA